MRTLTYLVAVTLDGCIAGPDGSFDAFIPEGDHIGAQVERWPETIPGHYRAPLGITGENREFDTVIMGRATYEVGSKAGITSPYGHLRQIVVSSTMRESPDPAVELVHADPLSVVDGLKRQAGSGIWLCGGGALAAALFPAIDELVLKVHPVVLGRGIPLFAERVDTSRFALVESTRYEPGVLFNRYRRGG